MPVSPRSHNSSPRAIQSKTADRSGLYTQGQANSRPPRLPQRLVLRDSRNGLRLRLLRIMGMRMELIGFRRSVQRRGRRLPARNNLRDFVEISRADEALMLHGLVPELLSRKLLLLKPRISSHPGISITARQVE